MKVIQALCWFLKILSLILDIQKLTLKNRLLKNFKQTSKVLNFENYRVVSLNKYLIVFSVINSEFAFHL